MNKDLLNKITITFSSLLIIFGALGMTITFIFMWSSDMRDIVGAGLGFIAGAVMLGSGVISLAALSTNQNQEA